jgi:bis(5'-nucleosyl)-tetraphosphatase (symmetrical)
MAIYAIGDVQGCFYELQLLLEHIHFDPECDHLWFTGDLVNRGPHSLETLRFVKGLGERAVVVLGNHDLHLLAVACDAERLKRHDTLRPVLRAPDRDELLGWLRHRPLLHHDPAVGFVLIHAGLPPQWGLALARSCAAEVEKVLRGPAHAELFRHMYGDLPDLWSDSLTGWDRLRFITNCLTRLRYCSPAGQLALRPKGPPGSQPAGYEPWFRIPGRASAGLHIVFGHWATLGAQSEPGIHALDSGCVWGQALTALSLDDTRQHFEVPCRDARAR